MIMLSVFFLSFFTDLFQAEEVCPSKENSFAVVGYIPEWRQEAINWQDVSSIATHIIIFSIEPRKDGSLDESNLIKTEYLQKAKAAIKQSKTDPKLLLCVGGNGRSRYFADVVKNRSTRRKFIAKLKKKVLQLELNGVDLNWEYPGYDFRSGYQDERSVRLEYQGLFNLIKEMHAEFVKNDLIITMAYYPDGKQEELLAQDGGVAQFLELMHMMSYDQRGDHSTWDFSKAVAKRGATILPPEKLTLGIPFYGRNPTGDWKSWEDIQKEFRPARGLNRAGSYFYNGPELVEKKVKLAKDLGLGGIMIWELGQDCRLHKHTSELKEFPATCINGEDSSLLFAVHRAVSSFYKDQSECLET